MKSLEMDNSINIDGTCLQGYAPSDISYQDLVNIFGEPNSENDGYKTDVEWTGTIEGRVFTIYNWKNGPNYGSNINIEDIKEWHIGGYSRIVVSYLLEIFEDYKRKRS